MLAPANRASGVLMTLFHMIFDDSMLAVHVVNSKGYLIRFPPTVHCDADMMRVFLLWSMVNDNASIGNCSILGNAENFCM
jgi:hypothetical protein